ncbi:MAG: hypothetical protein LAT50_13695 [Ectothiorhodospiraceae bacterium]|nr:hypothetical protein [Ectothiorhodospiraceae bacterium]
MSDPKQEHDDEFDAAFDEFTKDDGHAPSPGGEAPEDTGDYDELESEDTPDDEGEPDKKGDETAPEDTAASEDEEPDWQKRYEELEQKTKSWEGRISKAQREAEEARALAEAERKRREELEQAKAAGKKPAEGDDEQDTDDETDKDGDKLDPEVQGALDEYPDIAGPIVKHFQKQLQRAGQLSAKQMEQARDQLKQELQAEIAPIREEHDAAARKAHFDAIAEKHEDWEEHAKSGALHEWIDKQPDYLQEGMRKVLQSGTAQQAIDLLDKYKEANAEPEPPPNTNPRPRSLGAAEAVRGRRGPPPKAKAGKDDFDAAWDEAPD